MSFQKFLQEHQKESDRGCALIIASNLDNRLSELINSFFINIGEKQKKEIFDGNGCLSSFSSKINICHALGLIPKNEFDDLNIIRKIRNDFAHNEGGIRFTDQNMEDRCNSLTMTNDLKNNRPELSHIIDSARSAFVITACSISLILSERTKNTTRRNTPQKSSIA